MCNQCNYVELLNSSKLEVNENRLRVLEVAGNNKYPMSAADIFKTLERVSCKSMEKIEAIKKLWLIALQVNKLYPSR
jgi:hypothetical protein